MTRLLLYMTTVVMLLTACSDGNEDTGTTTNENAITLEASIGMPATRVTDTEQDSIIFAGERVYVWAALAATGAPYYMVQAWNVISDGDKHLYPADGGTRYYPPGNASINLLALHGRFDTSTTDGSPLPMETTHTVYTDQSIPANYYGSDLLYASVANQSARNHIEMRFNHVLCRIEVCLQPWGDITDADLVGAKVSIKDVSIKAKLNLATGYALTYGDSADVEMPLATIPAAAPDFSGAAYGAAVIPPQTVKGVFIQVELQNGMKFFYVPDWPIRFEAGKRYRFNMNLKHLMVLRPDDVEPWQFGADVDKVFDEPMTIIPYVIDWNTLYYNKGWYWMTVTPELVPDWDETGESEKGWYWMVVPPQGLPDWVLQENEKGWHLMLVPPQGLPDWVLQESDKGWWWLPPVPTLTDWDTTPGSDKGFGNDNYMPASPALPNWNTTPSGNFLFDVNDKNGNTITGTKTS